MPRCPLLGGLSLLSISVRWRDLHLCDSALHLFSERISSSNSLLIRSQFQCKSPSKGGCFLPGGQLRWEVPATYLTQVSTGVRLPVGAGFPRRQGPTPGQHHSDPPGHRALKDKANLVGKAHFVFSLQCSVVEHRKSSSTLLR